MRWIPLISLAALLCGACGPKLVRDTVVQSDTVLIELRQQVSGGEVVPRGYGHPVAIADVRLAHILASVTHEDGKGKRAPTIRSAHVYDLAEGITKALARATPDQDVIAAAFSADRRLGIFSDDHITVLGVHIANDQLVLEFYGIEDPLDKGSRRVTENAEYETPGQLPSTAPNFRLVPGQGQARQGQRALTVDWRDPYYRNPVSLRYRFGQVRRRTVLMEDAEASGEQPPPDTADPADLSDAQLRALDQLESARYAGYVTEAEYQRRRLLVLSGKLDEAGYGNAPE